MTRASLVLCTIPESEARSLTDRLLDERLIACANLVGPVTSRYRWQGEIEESTEMLLVLKTHPERVAELRARIAALHSYEVPEVLEFAATGGLDAYLAWLAASCSAADSKADGSDD